MGVAGVFCYKYHTAARIRFIIVFPLLYGFTLFSLLRANDGVDSPLLHDSIFLWIAVCGLLSILCIADELTSNEVVIFLTGVAAYPEDAADCEQLVECADKRLYQAKNAGKNQVFSE